MLALDGGLRLTAPGSERRLPVSERRRQYQVKLDAWLAVGFVGVNRLVDARRCAVERAAGDAPSDIRASI